MAMSIDKLYSFPSDFTGKDNQCNKPYGCPFGELMAISSIESTDSQSGVINFLT